MSNLRLSATVASEASPADTAEYVPDKGELELLQSVQSDFEYAMNKERAALARATQDLEDAKKLDSGGKEAKTKARQEVKKAKAVTAYWTKYNTAWKREIWSGRFRGMDEKEVVKVGIGWPELKYPEVGVCDRPTGCANAATSCSLPDDDDKSQQDSVFLEPLQPTKDTKDVEDAILEPGTEFEERGRRPY